MESSVTSDVCAECPEVPFWVSRGERAGGNSSAESCVMWRLDDLRADLLGLIVDQIYLLGSQVADGASSRNFGMHAVAPAGEAEDDRPSFGMVHFGVDDYTFVVSDRDLGD